MKLFWTAKSAAKELHMSERHLRRYLQELEIPPADLQGCKVRMLYILGVKEMDRLREHKSKCQENYHFPKQRHHGARMVGSQRP